MRNKIIIATLGALIAFTVILAATPTTGSCPTVNANNTTLARILIDRAEGGCLDNRVRLVAQGQWEISKYQEVIMPSDVLVTGAGSGALNGTYTYRGTYGGKPYYNLLGQPNSTDDWAIVWNINEWVVGGLFFNAYLGNDIVDYPWQTTYVTSDGDAPAPTVTELPAASFPPSIIAKQAVNRASTY